MSGKERDGFDLDLAEEVLGYSTERFDLGSDLRNLRKAQRAQAPEAVVLYGARILEVLAFEALDSVGVPPSSNVFSNLDALQQYDLIGFTTRCWAHVLRRLGNEVRHVSRFIGIRDGELALAFVERVMDWYFCRFPFGRRIPSLTRDGSPPGLCADFGLREATSMFDRPDFDPAAVSAGVLAGGSRPPFESAAHCSVLAEVLLDRGLPGEAESVLAHARRAYPEDLRLAQLEGLTHSRKGDLDAALGVLEPWFRRFSDDDEMAGIMAGVFKRVGQARPEDGRWLKRSHHTYLAGWKRSKTRNAYLGINAASTALWLGRCEESRELAREVRECLVSRRDALEANPHGLHLARNYWDQVTLAEAELLCGGLDEARRLFCDAFERHAQMKGCIRVCMDQLDRNLEALGSKATSGEFLSSREG